jgi:hypothetical protein
MNSTPTGQKHNTLIHIQKIKYIGTTQRHLTVICENIVTVATKKDNL